MVKSYSYVVKRHDPMEDENDNEEKDSSSVSYPIGGNSSGHDGNSSSSFMRTTSPYSSQGVGGCYGWGDVNRSGSASNSGPVDAYQQVKAGETLVRSYHVRTYLGFGVVAFIC